METISLENTLTFADTQIKLSNENTFNFYEQKFPKIDISFMRAIKDFEGVILPKFSWHRFGGQTMKDIRDNNYERFKFRKACSFDTYLTTEHPIQSGNPLIMDFEPYWNLSNHPHFDEIKKSLKDENRYTSLFVGNIPPEIQEFCVDAQKVFSDIYLIKEALNWKNEPIPTDDPLIIGVPHYIDFRKKEFYLLDGFNCSQAENYASREFVI